MGRKRLGPKAEWYAENGAYMVPVEMTIMVAAPVVVDFLIETIKRTGLPYAKTRAQCLQELSDRMVEQGMATKFDISEEDGVGYKEAAQRYVRLTFPDLLATPPGEESPVENVFLVTGSAAEPGSIGPVFLLACPLCGDRGQTSGAPSDDGTTYSLPMEGDCGHRWKLNIRTEGGKTRLYAASETTKPVVS